MSRTNKRSKAVTDMRAEYQFDYGQSRLNRFASRMKGDVMAVVLEPDVAQVFDTSESVNQLLRSVISAIPNRERRGAIGKPRKRRANKRMEPARHRG